LSAATGRLGYQADLELLGRTDTTGTDALNQNLSRSRVDAVSARLGGLGVRADALSGVPLGISNPLPARDGIDQAQANRSVAFVVRVRPEASGPEGPR
jgi:OOP family OmpA-OmpF porin